MPKKLKIWNGTGWGSPKRDKDNQIIPDISGKKYCDHFYVCATSRAQAIKIINECIGYNCMDQNEARNYWTEGCWGIQMEGIKQEIGVWTAQDWNDKPKRIYKKGK
jgi:hypothetical protein